MCERCQKSAIVMLGAILAAAPDIIAAVNERERAKRGTPWTAEQQAGITRTHDGIKLLAEMSRIYTDPNIGGEETVRAVYNLLDGDLEHRASPPALITGAKFAHYAALLLRDLASTLDRAVEARAAEMDPDAIRYIVGENADVHEEIAAHRRADRALAQERRVDEMEEIVERMRITAVPRSIFERAMQAAGGAPGGHGGNGSNGKGGKGGKGGPDSPMMH